MAFPEREARGGAGGKERGGPGPPDNGQEDKELEKECVDKYTWHEKEIEYIERRDYMNRDEILKKCRQENLGEDERERLVKGKAADAALSVMAVACLLLSMMKELEGIGSLAVQMVMYLTMFTYSLYKAIQLKRKFSAGCALIFAIAIVVNGYSMYMRVR